MRKSLTALTTILLAVSVASCTTNRLPRFDMSSGEPEQVRRYTGRPALDYIYRFDRRAFDQVDEMADSQLTADKVDVLARHGQPDYRREGVRARRNETFDEWAYTDRNVIVQFVQGELVYEGPLLDSDRILIERGYPSKAFFQRYEAGPVRETWIYEDPIAVRFASYSFSDGKIVFEAVY